MEALAGARPPATIANENAYTSGRSWPPHAKQTEQDPHSTTSNHSRVGEAWEGDSTSGGCASGGEEPCPPMRQGVILLRRFDFGPALIAFEYERIGLNGGGCTQWIRRVAIGTRATPRGCPLARRHGCSGITDRRLPKCFALRRGPAIGDASRFAVPGWMSSPVSSIAFGWWTVCEAAASKLRALRLTPRLPGGALR